MTLAVNHRSDAVVKMAESWPIIDALMGGTPTMRKAGEALLPKWPQEDLDHHRTRLSVATLFPAFQRTVSVMAGKPFAKALTLSKETPAQLVEWADDIDRQGVNLHTVAAEVFGWAVAWGFGGILVESPKAIRSNAARPPTQAEQREAGMRPYYVRVHPSQILGWRSAIVNGVQQLTQLRISEEVTEPDGDFGEKCVTQVRVLNRGSYSIYRETSTSSWVIVEEGLTGLDLIPFIPIYGRRTGFMRGEPPLLNLAYLNVKHWQSQSDQDTILHVARVPILLAKGFSEDDVITVGSSTAVKTTSKDADLKFVEHTGKSIEAGKQSLDDLEEQMIQTGAELLVAKPGQRTATESSNDAEANKSDLQRMAEGFEDSLDLAQHFMALYGSQEQGGKVTLFKDFAAGSLSEASAQLILGLQQGGLITKKTAIQEQQRRGVLSADIDPEIELAAAAEEGPDPGDAEDPEGAAA